jgi:hypothetical protein
MSWKADWAFFEAGTCPQCRSQLDMKREIDCPSCSRKLRLAEPLSYRVFKCPSCSCKFRAEHADIGLIKINILSAPMENVSPELPGEPQTTTDGPTEESLQLSIQSSEPPIDILPSSQPERKSQEAGNKINPQEMSDEEIDKVMHENLVIPTLQDSLEWLELSARENAEILSRAENDPEEALKLMGHYRKCEIQDRVLNLPKSAIREFNGQKYVWEEDLLIDKDTARKRKIIDAAQRAGLIGHGEYESLLDKEFDNDVEYYRQLARYEVMAAKRERKHTREMNKMALWVAFAIAATAYFLFALFG